MSLLFRRTQNADAALTRGAGPRPSGAHTGATLDFTSLPVFLINGAEDYAARKWSEQQLALQGFRSYERINGVVVEADDCLRLSGEGCQQGLALAHFAAWTRIAQRRLPAALILEDDVVFHRDFASLLPRYLAQVPADWACIWLGHLPRNWQAPQRAQNTLTVDQGVAPWTLHAYVLSYEGAELLSRTYDFLLARGNSAHALRPYAFATPGELERYPWALSYRELKSDYFTALVLRYFVPPSERHRWVALQSTRAVPAALGARSWVRGEDNELGRGYKTRCSCELLGDTAACGPDDARSRLPVMGTGLAYQNLCRYRRWALHNWLGAPGAAKVPSCAWLRARIAPSRDSDPSPHDCVDDVYPPLPRSTTPKEAVGGGGDDNTPLI